MLVRLALLAGTANALIATAAPALADPREISDTVKDPVATATASNNTPGDITIDSGGSVTLDSGTAVTINSSNTVTNNGTITTGGAGSTAVLIDGSTPINMTLNNVGTISSTNSTGPGNYGVRLMGGPVQGTINLGTASNVTVAGANSFGVSIESPFTGAITLNSVVVSGTGSTAISITAPVVGAVTLTGTSSASIGMGTGFISTAPITGALANNGTVNAGVEQTTNSDGTIAPAAAGKATMWIGANVTGGFVNTGTVAGVAGTTGLLVQPVNTAPQNIELSPVGSGNDNFGIVNRGVISSSSLSGAPATAVDISGTTISGTPYTVKIDNGLVSQANASISASAAGATATGIHVGAGATVPTIINQGSITSSVSSSNGTAYGVLIATGGNVQSLTNSGTIKAAGFGAGQLSFGIVDASGTLTSIANSGTITADTSNGATGVAIDLAAGTTPQTVSNAGTISGDIIFGTGGGTYSANSGTLSGLLSFGGGASAVQLAGTSLFTGPITVSAGSLGVTLADSSTLDLQEALPLSSISASGQSKLILPILSTGTVETVSGAASFTGQSVIGIRIEAPNTASTITLLTANGGLTTDHPNTLLDPSLLPYLYTVTNQTVTANSIQISLARKTGLEAGFAPGLAPLYDQSFAALGNGTAFQAIANLPDQKSVLAAYRQIAPGNYGSATLRIAQSLESAASERMQARTDALLWAPPTKSASFGVWAAEDFQDYHKADSQTDPGYRGTLWGLSFGIDHRIGKNLFAGLSMSFDWADADFDGVETSKSKALRQSGEKLTAYGGGHAGPFFAQFALTAGHDRYHSDRDIDIAGFTATKDATWNGNQLAAQATIGGHFRLGRAWIEPSDTFSWLRIHQNGYTEQNGEVLDLAVSSEKINGDTNAAKLAAGYAVPAADGAISFELRGSYLSQLDRNLPGLVVRYANEDTPFTLETNRLPSHEIREGLSVAYQPKDADWRFSVNASHEDYQGYSDTGLAIAARAKF